MDRTRHLALLTLALLTTAARAQSPAAGMGSPLAGLVLPHGGETMHERKPSI